MGQTYFLVHNKFWVPNNSKIKESLGYTNVLGHKKEIVKKYYIIKKKIGSRQISVEKVFAKKFYFLINSYEIATINLNF